MFDFLLGFFILTCAIIGVSKFTSRYELSTRVKRTTALIITIPVVVGVFIGLGFGISYYLDPSRNILIWESQFSKYWLNQEFKTDAGGFTTTTWSYDAGNDWIGVGTMGAATTIYNLTENYIEDQPIFTAKDYMYYRNQFRTNQGGHGKVCVRFYTQKENVINETYSTYTKIDVCGMYYHTDTGKVDSYYVDLDDVVHWSTPTYIASGLSGFWYMHFQFYFTETALGLIAKIWDSGGGPLTQHDIEMPHNAPKISSIEITAEHKSGGWFIAEVDNVLIFEATEDELAWGWVDGLFLIFKPLFDAFYRLVTGIVTVLAWAFGALVAVLVAMLNAVGNAIGAGNLGTAILGIGTAIINFLSFVLTNIANIFGWVVDLVGTGLAFVVDFLPWLAIIPALIMFDFIFIALRMGKSMSLDPLKDGVEKYMAFGMIIFRVFRGIASVLMGFLGFIAGLVPFT